MIKNVVTMITWVISLYEKPLSALYLPNQWPEFDYACETSLGEPYN